ncbi:BPTD_3080 family restriction endonuclease [Naasia sp. SYSU D00948]|uniref:BPTD_3080 family restriction endonuclease n=1 Tax=Naasia sp. SYSU D00948 TaxID=2817379 RepID=UPI001B30797A|nr:DEAD/DEAH box helicase family protein [Naasia sp. SYSU D00948]
MDLLANPVINVPYEEPMRHFVLDEAGRPTGEIANARRRSEFFVPVPKPKKSKKSQATQLAFDLTDEKVERNDAIDQLRDDLRYWRLQGYAGVTPITRKLLEHWSDPKRENRILFAQREAAETAIYLAEVVGRDKYTRSRAGGIDWRATLEEANTQHNAGLPRRALKMATGSGKTVVMCMLIAWQALNKTHAPHDARFSNRFLVVTPGITIRDRLRVLKPGDPENYYDLRGLVPADLRQQLNSASIAIINYHQFIPRDAKEIKGVASATRKLLLAGKSEDPFKETPQAVVSRVLKSLPGKGDIVVLNDEAHHCYQPRDLDEKVDADVKEANEDAKVWFRGLADIRKHAGIKAIYDLSATPFYLSGSGWSEGLIFPWTVSDFSLMDAIESGIVKVPRLPVDDDAQGDQVSYLHLYDQIKDDANWPRTVKAAPKSPAEWVMPAVLEGALRSLYKSYERAYAGWERTLKNQGEPPPVMIVVAPNTVASKLIYDWIAGYELADGDQTKHVPGALDLFSNSEHGAPLARPRTIIVDSKQLESGEPIKADFKAAAADEIEAFQKEYRLQRGGVEDITDADLLREVMNTVGKKGRLGEPVRCVVSVSMLTEGWDANTVTHILGVRPFRSQLLCEQVIGRGLRRRDYSLDPETDMFGPEYSNVYGIPFSFIPGDAPPSDPKPLDPPTRVRALEGRAHLRIAFPLLAGYRIEMPDSPLIFDPAHADALTIGAATVPSWVQSEGIVGEKERIDGIAEIREQEIAFRVASRVLKSFFTSQGDARPWLFPQLVDITKRWLRAKLHIESGYSIGFLSLAEPQQLAAEAIYNAITRLEDDESRQKLARPILRDPGDGSTDAVWFDTRKKTYETTASHVSHVTLDGKDGNTWEHKVARVCEELVAEGVLTSYVKNDHLGFTIPYVHKGRSHEYWPDFLLRLAPVDGEDFSRTLIVEVSGSQKSPGPTKEKARTARDSWCAAVNNHGGFGRWGYTELGKAEVDDAEHELRIRLDQLRADAPIIGDPDLLSARLLAGTTGMMEN